MYAQINNSGHEHNQFKLLKNKDEFFTCGVCKEIGNGDRYTCIHSHCHFHVHRLCAKPPDFVDHPFYQDWRFHFCRERRPFQQCNACGGDIKGANYQCYDNGKDLHPCCAHLPLSLLDNRGGGGATEGQQVALVLYPKLSSDCSICGKVKIEGLKTWYYETCKSNKLRFHVACVKKTLNQISTKMAVGRSRGASSSILRDGHGTMAACGSRVVSISSSIQRDGHRTMSAGGSRGVSISSSIHGHGTITAGVSIGASISRSIQRGGHGTMAAGGSRGVSISRSIQRGGHGTMAAGGSRGVSISRGIQRGGNGTMAAGGSRGVRIGPGIQRGGHGTMAAGGSRGVSIVPGIQRGGHGTMAVGGSRGVSISPGIQRGGHGTMAAGGSRGVSIGRGIRRGGHGTMAAGGSRGVSISRGIQRDGHGTMAAGGSRGASISRGIQRGEHGTMAAGGIRGASISRSIQRDGHGTMAAHSTRATSNMMPVVEKKKEDSFWKTIGKTALTMILTALIGQIMPIGAAAIANGITSLIDIAITYLF